MEQDGIADCVVTPDEDHLLCLTDYLRRDGARLNIEGELWSMCWGKGDPLNAKLADIIEKHLAEVAGL